MLKKLCLVFFVGCSPWTLESALERSHVEIVEVEPWVERWAEGDEDVKRQFSLLEESLQEGLDKGLISAAGVEEVTRAVTFAAEKHHGQFRKNKNKTPYIIHPLGVADHVMRIGKVYDVDVIIAALLHDTMDGTGTTYEEIGAYFGLKVMQYVQEVTGDLTLSSKEQKKQQIIQAPHQSKGASVIKLADKLHNLNTLMKDPSEGWNQDRLDGYFQWVQAVIDHLPKVNESLKDAVDKTIAKYWKEQNKK